MSNADWEKYTKRDRWGKTSGEILHELLKEKGIETFETFMASGEGRELPTGLEEASWRVLMPDGKLRDCWLKWDEKRLSPDGGAGYYMLKIDELDPSDYTENVSYIAARKRLGLPLTEEQKAILEKYPELM